MAAVEQFHPVAPEQFEEFEEWSSNVAPSDGCLDDWSDFNDSSTWEGEGDRPASPVPTQRSTEPAHQSSEGFAADNPWDVFRECFPTAEKREEDEEEEGSAAVPADLHVPTLAELLRTSTGMPLESEHKNRALGVCSRLLCEEACVRLSGPKPNTYSRSQLINTLPLVDPDTHNAEDMALPDMELEQTENPPATLIQTKLVARSLCREPPAFMYQVSMRWLRQWNANILLQAADNAGKGLHL
ncbi:uncharacterized protein si:dkey-229e3.2 isoform X2 [Engraulis encrasicolus]|uniref:uncharacterized protein si:dkey-229e3.2 isoform X2 n=1 Tax=Engraulis encrasicolus TaxID=184585 RepID=UPI002FD474DF